MFSDNSVLQRSLMSDMNDCYFEMESNALERLDDMRYRLFLCDYALADRIHKMYISSLSIIDCLTKTETILTTGYKSYIKDNNISICIMANEYLDEYFSYVHLKEQFNRTNNFPGLPRKTLQGVYIYDNTTDNNIDILHFYIYV